MNQVVIVSRKGGDLRAVNNGKLDSKMQNDGLLVRL